MKDRERPDEMDREDVLQVASRIVTDRHDPHTVLPTADHLLMWLTGDGAQDGVRHRRAAMMRQFYNISNGLSAPGVSACADDIDGFIAAADQYVPFLSGASA